jgi:cytoplasmic iron level regulating protein YaaA (DUF328/UPF0246 family)
MLVLLSPSKNLHNVPLRAKHHSHIRFPEETSVLIDTLKKQSVKSLGKLMEINEKLARLNIERYQEFSLPHHEENATPAMFTFRGEVYLGLEAATLSEVEVKQAQKVIRILSGLYGLLRPLDLIQPYRLEMGVELKSGKTKTLYDFWGSKITDALNEDVRESKSREIINLASQEYSKAIQEDIITVPVIQIQFLEERNGKLQFLSFNAKRSRGWMARYIVQHKIKTSRDLKAFMEQGYTFREDLSEDKKMVFVR